MGSRPFRPAWTGQLGLRTLPRPPDPSLGQDRPCDPEQITVPIETGPDLAGRRRGAAQGWRPPGVLWWHKVTPLCKFNPEYI